MEKEDLSMSVGLLGAGGQADETEMYLAESGRSVAFRAVDAQYVASAGSGAVALEAANSQVPVVAAIGAPGTRKKMLEKWSGTTYATVISRHAVVGPTSSVAPGSIVAPGAIVTTKVTIGRHVLVNTGVTIGHDTTIGEYTTLSPGVHVGGNVKMGDGVFVGLGAVIKQGVSIANGAVIGAGAVVLHDIDEPNSVHVGVPAKQIAVNEDWLHKL